jgi:hypothetical protein
MGLAERRVTYEFLRNKRPKLPEAIDYAAEFELPIEVRWNELATEGYPHRGSAGAGTRL